MSVLESLSGARIFDGENWHERSAVLVASGRVQNIVAETDIPSGATRTVLDGGSLVPGFIDLQVNGGGGVLFNNAPTVDSIRTICAAHAQFGTAALLPTLITDTVPVTEAAIAAGIAAQKAKVPGFLGLHLEGPHLALARKGTHDPALIRPMDDDDLARLIEAAKALPNLICTVAAETVTPDQIAAMASAGITVSIGHSDATRDQAALAFDAGATMATHLFNAMSQLGNREPGVVGAVLERPNVSAGIIADGIHVHPVAMSIALRAKATPARIFLVTDAMSQTGTDLTSFTLNGRTIHRANGALRLEDGTLAGADLDMIDAVNYTIENLGLPVEEAFRMASLYPAQAIGVSDELGHLKAGAVANMTWLSPMRRVQSTWAAGERVWIA